MGLKARPQTKKAVARSHAKVVQQRSALAEVGDVFAYPVPGGGYGACQVLVRNKRLVNIVPLNNTWLALPDQSDVEQAKAVQRHYDDGIWVEGLGYRTDHVGPDGCWVESYVPWWATWVARLAPKEPKPKVTVVDDQWRRHVHRHHHKRRALKFRTIESSELAGKTRLDLSTEKIDSISVEAKGEPLTIVLPPTTYWLGISGSVAGLRIVNKASSDWPFRVRLDVEELAQPIPGLEGIQALEVKFRRTVDAKHLAQYPQLVALDLWSKNGRLDHIAALSKLPALQELKLEGIYHCDAALFPDDLPSLRVVRIRGTRKTTADTLKGKLKGVPRVKITGVKTDAWLAENLDNPFRDWGEVVSAGLARGAIAAWKSASREVAKLKPSTGKKAKAVLRSFVEALNRLDARYDIETAERESACDAFLVLGAKAGVAGHHAQEWFDEWREF